MFCLYQVNNLPQLREHKLFTVHEVARKDVERAFGVLLARFSFLRHPCRSWDNDIMGKNYDQAYNRQRRTSTEDDIENLESTQRIVDMSSYITNKAQLHDREAHNTLKTI
uniref:Uncharacterized protein n=1 Tax=Lactuca sativa TaxID=4236 RepID=A0A9R1URC7_LACSA|nr:hypothetical protein LSAT_V11C800401900 [Lactuca sativa]